MFIYISLFLCFNEKACESDTIFVVALKLPEACVEGKVFFRHERIVSISNEHSEFITFDLHS